mmetsp:Transcript_17591/g.46582  ORF Transcript_17591/g.46582 Transcript_17591/m.46582 type:complete len:90 (+) Transcript_17591:2-271(+)
MFMAVDERGDERLIIFCHDAGTKTGSTGRMAAERLVNELIQEKLRDDGGGGRGRSDSRRRSPSRRKDSRSPPPKRRDDSRRRSRSRSRR